MIATSLAGIVVAALLFSALLWTIYRACVATGHVRLAAWLLATATLIGMATISINMPNLGIVTGVVIALLSSIGIWTEARWSKLLPMVQLLFGLALIARLPWA